MSIASQPLPGAVAPEEHNDVDHTSVSLAVSTVILALRPKDNETHPTLWLPLNKEEDNEATTLKQDIGTYVEENISKMLVGQLPMSYWDTYVKDVKDAGADRLVEIYSQAYDRVMGK